MRKWRCSKLSPRPRRIRAAHNVSSTPSVMLLRGVSRTPRLLNWEWQPPSGVIQSCQVPAVGELLLCLYLCLDVKGLGSGWFPVNPSGQELSLTLVTWSMGWYNSEVRATEPMSTHVLPVHISWQREAHLHRGLWSAKDKLHLLTLLPQVSPE